MNDATAGGTPGATTGGVRTLLRLEGLALLLGMLLLYWNLEGSWWVFALLFLAPDVSFLAYLADARAARSPTMPRTAISCRPR